MKTIQLITSKSMDYSSIHIQKSENDDGVRTMCGKIIKRNMLKPIKKIDYDQRKTKVATTVKELRTILISDCIFCLRLESGLFKRSL